MEKFVCASGFIRSMYQDHSKSLDWKIPMNIAPYVKKLIELHNTPGQLLTKPQFYNNEWTYLTQKRNFMNFYDENDVDLMIDPIDDTKYRKMLAVCFEAYLRRQLILLYSDPNIILKNLTLRLPTLNVYGNDANDIRLQQVKVRYFSLCDDYDYKYSTGLMPPEYRQLTWHNRKNPELPKFRCCPSLLNSMDCMSLLYENMENPTEEIMIKTAYFLRPFRFVLPLTFLFDIFGGFGNILPIEFNFPDHPIKNRFPDNTLLIDKVERVFLEEFKNRSKHQFCEEEVMLPRRANAFLAGGFVCHMLGLTSAFMHTQHS